LNAQDPSYYKQTLPTPKYTIWILIKNTIFLDGGYVKRRLVEEGIKHNVQIRLMNPNKFDLAVTKAGPGSLVYAGEIVEAPDAVMPRVGANVDYFGLAVLRQLEALGVTVFNPVNSIEIARDKLYTHQVLSTNGIPIPRSLLSRVPIEYDFIESKFSYPMIIKLASGSRGESVWKCDSREQLQELMKTIDTTKPMIIQEFLKLTKGRDLRCFIVGNKMVAACMRQALTGEFKANVIIGDTYSQTGNKNTEAVRFFAFFFFFFLVFF
jgi:gamma-F420-2:alpha-L-glutamate ligase